MTSALSTPTRSFSGKNSNGYTLHLSLSSSPEIFETAGIKWDYSLLSLLANKSAVNPRANCEFSSPLQSRF